MSQPLTAIVLGSAVLFTTTAWGQFPIVTTPYPGGFPQPAIGSYMGGPQWSVVRAHPLTGAIEARTMVIDPVTGHVQYHQRLIPRHAIGQAPAVLDTTIDPATGAVRYHSFSQNPWTGALQSDSRVENLRTGTVEQQQSVYRPNTGHVQTTRQGYDSATRRRTAEVTEFDPQTGTYYRRGAAIDPHAQANQATVQQRGQTRVYEWSAEQDAAPPQAADAPQDSSAAPAPDAPAAPDANQP